jgi:hypothetical protein
MYLVLMKRSFFKGKRKFDCAAGIDTILRLPQLIKQSFVESVKNKQNSFFGLVSGTSNVKTFDVQRHDDRNLSKRLPPPLQLGH